MIVPLSLVIQAEATLRKCSAWIFVFGEGGGGVVAGTVEFGTRLSCKMWLQNLKLHDHTNSGRLARNFNFGAFLLA